MNTSRSTPTAPITKEGLRALIHAFYSDIGADPSLGPIFSRVIGTDWSAHLERMVEFWSTVMLGSRSFRGNVFGKHMAIEGIAPAHFTRWLSLWQQHTTARFEPAGAAELQRIAQGIARNLFHGFFDGRHEFPLDEDVRPSRAR
jgi:hemoglobin